MVKFQWLDYCEKSFEELKTRWTTTPVLTISKGSDGYVIYYDVIHSWPRLCVDASRKGIACAFRQRKVYDKNYSTHELEFASVVFALKIWRHYLWYYVDMFTTIRAFSICSPKKSSFFARGDGLSSLRNII